MADLKYNLTFTGSQVEALLSLIGTISQSIPERVSQLTNDAGYVVAADVPTKLSDLDNDAGFVTSSAVPTNVSSLTNDAHYTTESALAAEEARAQGVERTLSDDVTAIKSKIPAAASSQNKLADKEFVNSSISTATADFKGTYATIAELRQQSANLNDYGFVYTTDSAGNTVYNRYKYNGSAWVFEYALNNSSFTSAQWAAINSMMTQALQQKLTELPTNSALQTALNSKQPMLTFDNAPTAGSNNPVKSKGIKSAMDDLAQELDARADALETFVANGSIGITFDQTKGKLYVLTLSGNDTLQSASLNQTTGRLSLNYVF